MTQENDKTYKGGCMCGQVQYRFSAFKKMVLKSCHCVECRIHTGHIMSNIGVPDANFTWVKNETLHYYQSSEHLSRGFCSDCGSLMVVRQKDLDFMVVMAGGIEDTTGIPFGFHYFSKEKGDYYEIPEGERQFARFWYEK